MKSRLPVKIVILVSFYEGGWYGDIFTAIVIIFRLINYHTCTTNKAIYDFCNSGC